MHLKIQKKKDRKGQLDHRCDGMGIQRVGCIAREDDSLCFLEKNPRVGHENTKKLAVVVTSLTSHIRVCSHTCTR